MKHTDGVSFTKNIYPTHPNHEETQNPLEPFGQGTFI